MPETTRKLIDYTVVCVNEFARKKALHPRAAFLYLYRYKGIEFLKENYWTGRQGYTWKAPHMYTIYSKMNTPMGS